MHSHRPSNAPDRSYIHFNINNIYRWIYKLSEWIDGPSPKAKDDWSRVTRIKCVQLVDGTVLLLYHLEKSIWVELLCVGEDRFISSHCPTCTRRKVCSNYIWSKEHGYWSNIPDIGDNGRSSWYNFTLVNIFFHRKMWYSWQEVTMYQDLCITNA